MRRTFFVLVFAVMGFCCRAQGPLGPGPKGAAHRFALGDSNFLLDGTPFQMISGEMHYTRVPREAWRQRMRMARAMGLNTVGTYVFWNVHEPEKGKFDFSGNNDIAAFVRTAQEEGLWVVLRPSPYVCAEWEFGGYPYWLEKEAGLVVRSKEPKYLEEYRRYIREVGRQLAPLQVNHGGNILMVQIENEYGSYGNDKEYLDLNRQLFVEAGFDGLLYTCDPAGDLEKGYLPGLLPAVNGVDRPERVKEIVQRHHGGKGPYYIAEWYPAWFDWWGTRHHRVAAGQYAGRLDSVLGAGISINMYMFHGGTTRGFMNGANVNDRNPYEPQISSYDYDAPLDEAGNATPKFMAFRKVIQKHLPPGIVLPDVPVSKPAINTAAVQFTDPTPLFDFLPLPVTSEDPLTFEDLGQAYGWVLYRTELTAGGSGLLRLPGLRDFAVVLVNGQRAGVLDRCKAQDSLALELPAGKVRLDILAENLGRVNFGPYLLHNLKGITGQVFLSGRVLKGWQMYRLPFAQADSLGARRQASVVRRQTLNGTGVPVIRKGILPLGHPADTYLDMTNWGKGCIWVNGHNLGRYWNVGPQQTVYVPAEWLHTGDNEITVFEILKPGAQELRGIDHPILDQLNNVDTAAAAQSIPAVPSIPSEYKLVWSDEFDNDGAPDPAKWTFEKGFVRNQEFQWYQPENAVCRNGLLTIEARHTHQPNPNYDANSKDWRKNRPFIDYTSACLKSIINTGWKYGIFEMRGRIDVDPGCWPAWWTLGVERPWPANGEIDIMEYYRNRLLANAACMGAQQKPQWSSKTLPVDSLGGQAWAKQFHVWRMYWDADSIILTMDGATLNKINVKDFADKDGSGFEPFKQHHYMLLNLAIGGQNGGDPENTSFPRRFEVDYVRVYQKTQ